jgi:hypothetical protein
VYKGGYAAPDRECPTCGEVKPIPTRNKYCSRSCASKGRAPEIERLMSPVKTAKESIEPEGGFAENARSSGSGNFHTHPTGFVDINPETGTGRIITPTFDKPNPSNDEALEAVLLDPKDWKVIPTGLRRFQDRKGEWKSNLNAKVFRRTDTLEDDPDYVAISKEIRAFKPRKTPVRAKAQKKGPFTLLVTPADAQLGKPDRGGVEGTYQRVLQLIDDVPELLEEYRRAGYYIPEIAIVGMGDMIENCAGHYDQQTAATGGVNLRDQIKIARDLIWQMVETWSPLVDRAIVGAVGGNHGENRQNGKSFTDFADNHDVAVFEWVMDKCSANPFLRERTKWFIPNDELILTLDLHGAIYGFTHGHIIGKSSANLQKKVDAWWAQNSHHKKPLGDAAVLITAHFHHWLTNQQGLRTWFQAPALEGGSKWFEDGSGRVSAPGTLTLLAGATAGKDGRGWAKPEIL